LPSHHHFLLLLLLLLCASPALHRHQPAALADGGARLEWARRRLGCHRCWCPGLPQLVLQDAFVCGANLRSSSWRRWRRLQLLPHKDCVFIGH
jgi:hypothetical protein